MIVKDCPSDHTDGKMTILNMKAWTQEDGSLSWIHYKKPLANQQLAILMSALPVKVKRETNVEEGVTILRNITSDLTSDVKTKHLLSFLSSSSYRNSVRSGTSSLPGTVCNNKVLLCKTKYIAS
jgi:hypothetical protein